MRGEATSAVILRNAHDVMGHPLPGIVPSAGKCLNRSNLMLWNNKWGRIDKTSIRPGSEDRQLPKPLRGFRTSSSASVLLCSAAPS